MQRHNNYSTTIALTITVHEEGLLLVPALQSALGAAEACQAEGVACVVAVLGCAPDARTRRIVERFQARSSLVGYTELAPGTPFHQHALTQINAEFYCFLNGDDILQREWPLSAYRHARQSKHLNCIYHSELLAGFGDTLFVRTQLKSNDPIFHPLHCLLSQHFGHNMFCHAAILEHAPALVRQSAAPHAFETWHWGCETLALGIGRDWVPGTVQFCRLDAAPARCEAVAARCALLQDALATGSYGAFSGLHDGARAGQLAAQGALRYRDALPDWLYREAKRASAFDSEVYALLNASGALACETPPISLGAGYLLARAARFCAESYTMVAVDCDALGAEQAATLELGLRQARQRQRILVLCGDALTHGTLAREEAGICYLNLRMAARACDGPALPERVLAAVLANCAPRALVNLNFDLVDEFCGRQARLLAASQVPTVRYLLDALEDVHTGYNERRVLAALNQGRFACTHLAVTHFDNYRYARSLYGAAGLEVLLVPARLSHIGAVLEHMAKQSMSGLPAAAPAPATVQAPGPVDVSCILNLHREGNILIPTFRSIARMLHFAQQQGIVCELVLVLDRADGHSRRLAIEAQSGVLAGLPSSLCEVDNGDLGRSRRDGVAQARGSYIAFLDGDDLYSENWIAEAFLLAQSEAGQATIYHPELNVYFGEHHRTFWHPDAQALGATEKAGLLLENFWTSLSFGPRALYQAHPVDDNGLQQGFGYEDWQWNMRTSAEGIAHRPVPRTLHFIRLKPSGSLNSHSSKRSVIVRPSRLAERLVFGKSGKAQQGQAPTLTAG
ncbi:glycosyltransferase family 2 protein [Massilia sp. 9I]|uniref:glycosyltransferase family 2 protein n=1 Tax=Massilia sp. 9I TaxID=2653152 RepID=UPI0012EFC57F|nr:glycosyltransferase family 2 protein [Massilia sp. 9I]VXC66171.1 hypothetical protein MASSI9I_90197 [Massilia sp. 9I]